MPASGRPPKLDCSGHINTQRDQKGQAGYDLRYLDAFEKRKDVFVALVSADGRRKQLSGDDSKCDSFYFPHGTPMIVGSHCANINAEKSADVNNPRADMNRLRETGPMV